MGIVFLGDFMLGRYILPDIEMIGLKSLLEPIRRLINGNHIVANLESPLSRCHFPNGKGDASLLSAPIEMATQLRQAGVSAVSLGNNHIFDFGVKGLTDTILALDTQDIKHTGAGMDLDSATKPVFINVDGYKVGILAFSYTPQASKDKPGVAYIYDDTVNNTISKVRKNVDFLVVMPHAGIEFYQYPLIRDQNVYRKMIELGADLIIGSHPHCIQAMEIYKDRFIFYSLGDSFFDHYHEAVWEERLVRSSVLPLYAMLDSPDPPEHSLSVKLNFVNGNPKIIYEPLKSHNKLGPNLMEGEERKRWLVQFEKLCMNLQNSQSVQEKRAELQNMLFKTLKKRGLLLNNF